MKHINLCKKTKICKGNLGVTRNKMPQINEAVMKDYLKFIKKSSKVAKRKFNVNTLKPTQNELSLNVIRKKQLKLSKHNKNPPIIISNDNYILDGHHRWATLRDCNMFPKNCNTKLSLKIDAYKIDMPIKKLLKKTRSFKHVTYE
tara:strand:+ start:762 stop:1196 length:435 start_codon:yes stop_codon:yes gene_type:complete